MTREPPCFPCPLAATRTFLMPPVQGVRGWSAGGRVRETQFKPGGRPHSWLPIGSERTSKDGYLQRKVTDTGYPPRDGVGVHILIWREHCGEIPPGHVVVFRDRNKHNLQLGNLELISRAENCRRNSIHRYPPELKEVIRLQKRLDAPLGTEPMKNKMTDLRNHLFATLEALQDTDNPMDIERAKAICQVGSVLVASAKVEVDFINALGGDTRTTGFIESAPALPGGR